MNGIETNTVFIQMSPQENDISRNLYWQNEVPVYDPNKMNAIPASFLIDTVVTHIPHLHIVNYSPKTTLANGL